MKRIDAVIYFQEVHTSTTVWVDDAATDDDIKNAIIQEALEMIEIEYHER